MHLINPEFQSLPKFLPYGLLSLVQKQVEAHQWSSSLPLIVTGQQERDQNDYPAIKTGLLDYILNLIP